MESFGRAGVKRKFLGRLKSRSRRRRFVNPQPEFLLPRMAKVRPPITENVQGPSAKQTSYPKPQS